MRNFVSIIYIFFSFFSSFVPSVFAESGNSELKDRYEIEQNLNSEEASFGQMVAVSLLGDYLKSGRKDPWITAMFQKALNNNPNLYAVTRALEILEETNDPEIEGIVREFCEKRKDFPQSIKDRAIITLHEIQLNQKSFEEYVENLKKEVSESTIEKHSQRMINFFDYNDVFTYFHNMTNEGIKSEADQDRLSILMNAIGESENERLKSAILPDILKLAPESNRAVSVLKFFDPNLTHSTLLSIIGNENIDPRSIRADAIESLFYNLPPERYDETIKKIKEIISDDEYFMAVLNNAIKKWKEKNGTETEENNEESMPERVEEEVEDKKIINSIAPCIGGITASAFLFKKMKKNIDEISRFVNSQNISKLAVQRPEDTSKMYSKAKEIENHLRNALERFEIDTQVYEVAVEPIEKDILRLNNEINGPFPGTLKRAATEVADVFRYGATEVFEIFGYNVFETNRSRRRETEKKRFELRKKEREILDPALEELKTAYNEGVQFFNSYRSIGEKSFPYMDLNERELPQKSREMLSEFSKLQQKQNHN